MDLKAEIKALGYSAAHFRRECGGIAPQTFDKIVRGENVHYSILEMVKRKLEELRRRPRLKAS